MTHNPNPTVAQLCLQAHELMLRKMYSLAEERAQEAIGCEPHNPLGYAALARILNSNGQYCRAIQVLREGLQNAPSDAECHRLIAGSQRLAGAKKDALMSAIEAVRLAPRIPLAHVELGLAYDALNQYSKADQSLATALELDSELFLAHAAMGDMNLKRRRLVEAEKNFRKAIEIDPSRADVINNLGVVLTRTKQHEDAALCFKSAVLIDPTLEFAIKNTKQSVAFYLDKGTTTILCAVWMIAGPVCLLSGLAAQSTWMSMIATVALVIACVLYVRFVRKRRMIHLSTRDPQISELYQAILTKKQS